ncbi:uncharacterized protein LOC133779999 [Humulus lupulus]|uniref:uncharacterized protein LOC133779999 n=1 Tax=Humulus lupulus TaxID=3486 RepID=UPI002B414DCD|nr:uncharacterized protein LOC133779999 [Humulus lupulus]
MGDGNPDSKIKLAAWSREMDSDLDNVLNKPMVSKALVFFVQHNFMLNNEVPASREIPQETRDAQLRLEDELKTMKLDVAARDATIQKVYELKSKLEVALKEVQKVPDLKLMLAVTLKEVEAKNSEIMEKNSEIKEIRELNAKMEEEKKMTFKVIEGEKAHLLEEFKNKKDRAVDMAMYLIWVSNLDLDTSFLANLEADFIAKRQARLEEEEARLEAEEATEAARAATRETSKS